ncbi:MAG TPA: GNAT family N-acetyltransferase [Thermoplasmata archaeon]|nr:GNAT family N-acetyltransferase [Thermoplasmata archaeon]
MSALHSEKFRTSTVAIRDFQPEDYSALVAIDNASFPDYPGTVEELRYEDEHFDTTKYVRRRLVAVEPSGDVIGYANYAHMPWAFDPRRYDMWIGVDPRRQGQGIGRALYEAVLDEMRARDAAILKTSARESMTDAVGWILRRGFAETSRNWESHLDVRAFEPSRFSEYASPPEGIRIVTLKDELAEDPDRLRGVFEMGNLLGPDVPRTDPYTPPSWEMWRAMVVGSPWSFPEAFFLAKDGERYVGQSDLERSESQPGVLYTGFTGVLRAYRGRGIAQVLKLRALTFAKAHGYAEVRTWNSTLNAPMLGINGKLGFVRQPPWIQFKKDLGGASG